MKICILDGYTLNPGDLSWEGIQKLGDLTIYDRTCAKDVVERAKGFDIILTNKVVIDAQIMDQLPDLKYIGVLATGYNVVDIEYANRKGIIVTNIPAYSTMSVAQMVFAHILNFTNQIAHYTEENRNGRWSNSADFCYWDQPIMELYGKTIGLIGLGHIGMAVAKVALALGMKVIAMTSKKADQLPEGITPVSKDFLLHNADIVSLHCPLTETTKNFINKETLSMMKPTAIVINTGRGPLVNEQELADALNSGVIAGFGADVLSVEPAVKGNPLLSAKNCQITPHIAWASVEARKRLMDIAVENIRQFVSGEKVQNAIR